MPPTRNHTTDTHPSSHPNPPPRSTRTLPTPPVHNNQVQGIHTATFDAAYFAIYSFSHRHHPSLSYHPIPQRHDTAAHHSDAHPTLPRRDGIYHLLPNHPFYIRLMHRRRPQVLRCSLLHLTATPTPSPPPPPASLPLDACRGLASPFLSLSPHSSHLLAGTTAGVSITSRISKHNNKAKATQL